MTNVSLLKTCSKPLRRCRNSIPPLPLIDEDPSPVGVTLACRVMGEGPPEAVNQIARLEQQTSRLLLGANLELDQRHK